VTRLNGDQAQANQQIERRTLFAEGPDQYLLRIGNFSMSLSRKKRNMFSSSLELHDRADAGLYSF